MNSLLGYMGDVGVFEERRELGRPLLIPSRVPGSSGGSASGKNLHTEVRGHAGGEPAEEGEGTKFESALPTLPGKVCLGAPRTEKR